jgi:glycosyltransferase involved in cell wall biosynthesis
MENISIAIITYKRPLSLKKLLLALKEQVVDKKLSLSIIVIDNDELNSAKEIVDALHKYPFEIKLTVEKKRGIVAARNRAVSEFLKTEAESLIFIDDDEWPVKSNWLMTLLEVQKRYEADIVYSDVETIPESKQIEWVNIAFTLNRKEKKVAPTDRFYTHNLLLTRDVLERLNPPFDERFALTGSSDLHFCLKANKLNFKAYYTPDAPVQELFFESRANFKWFFLRGYRIGEGSTRAHLYEGEAPKIYLYILFMFIGRVGRAFQMLLQGVYKRNKGYLTKSYMYLGTSIGTLLGFFNIQYNEYSKTHGK